MGDATNFTLDEPVNAVFSNAVFHWIDDQDALIGNIATALKPDGSLVCEFGGDGCTETIHAALEQSFQNRNLNYKRTFYFPTIGEYTPLLERHGLKVTYAILFNRMTKLVGENGMEDWIKMFIKQPFKGLSEDIVEEIINEAVNHLKPLLYQDGSWYADYVRIRIKAIKTA